MRTSLLILKKFAQEARAAGEIPIILHIPKKNDIKCLEQGDSAGPLSNSRRTGKIRCHCGGSGTGDEREKPSI